MRAFRRYAPALAIPVVVVVVAILATTLGSRTPSAMIGREGPAFGLAIEAGPGAGSGAQFEVARGNVTVIDFWASWCPPCRESAPLLNQLSREFAEARFVGVNVEGLDTQRLRQAHASFGYRFPSVVDRSGEVAASFGVQSLPTLVILDADRRVALVERGLPDEDGLRRALRRLVQGQSGGSD